MRQPKPKMTPRDGVLLLALCLSLTLCLAGVLYGLLSDLKTDLSTPSPTPADPIASISCPSDKPSDIDYPLPFYEIDVPPAETLIAYNPIPAAYLGTFTLTAYCPCEQCCGKWAKSRPIVYGKPLVLTASGMSAREGITIAVDPAILPHGTAVYIEGIGVRIAQDSGVTGNRIDVYFARHEDAAAFGKQLSEVWALG